MKSKILVSIFLPVLACAATKCLSGQTQFWSTLEAGPHAVGFRTFYLRDTLRRWEASITPDAAPDLGRPIRVSLWYPATASGGSEMRYGDYFHYDGPPDFRSLNDTLERSDRLSWLDDLTEETPNGRVVADSLFAMPVAARHDAPAADGRFPVILYSGGKGSRADANVELGEYLASYGYVVVTVPQLGPSAQDLELGSSPSDIMLHVRDLAFAWKAVRKLSIVDTVRLAVAGHSSGGVVALQFAMLYLGVRAVVGLDGSYGMFGEGGQRESHRTLIRDFPAFDSDHFTAPLLDLRRANGVQGAELDSTVVADLRSSDRYVITLPRMYHGDFTEWAPLAVRLGVPWPTGADGRTRQSALDGNQHAYRAILDFFRATLQGSSGGITAMIRELQALDGVTVVHKPVLR